MITKNSYVLGLLSCFFATTSWGLLYVVLGVALEYVDPVNITAMRFIMTSAAFCVILLLIEGFSAFKNSFKAYVLAFVVGSFGFAGTSFLTLLAQSIIGGEGAVRVSVILSTTPLLTLLIVWLLRGKRPTIFSFICLLLSFFGILLVITKGDISSLLDAHHHPLANLLILAAATNFVLYSMASQLFPQWGPVKYSAITTIMGTITIVVVDVILTFLGVIHLPTISSVVSILPHMFYVSFIATCLGLLLWNYGTKIISSVNSMPFMNLTPIVALLVSLFLGIIPSHIQIYGVIITVSALLIHSFYTRKNV